MWYGYMWYVYMLYVYMCYVYMWYVYMFYMLRHLIFYVYKRHIVNVLCISMEHNKLYMYKPSK